MPAMMWGIWKAPWFWYRESIITCPGVSSACATHVWIYVDNVQSVGKSRDLSMSWRNTKMAGKAQDTDSFKLTYPWPVF